MSSPDPLRPPRRALRRHHAARKKAWVRRSLLHYFLDPEQASPRRVGLYSETPKVCSCWMCGNPRRFRGEVTRQEHLCDQRFELDEAVEEMDG